MISGEHAIWQAVMRDIRRHSPLARFNAAVAELNRSMTAMALEVSRAVGGLARVLNAVP